MGTDIGNSATPSSIINSHSRDPRRRKREDFIEKIIAGNLSEPMEGNRNPDLSGTEIPQ